MVQIIGVIGGSVCSKEIEELAFEVGREIAKRGGLLVCGGLGGVMTASAKGAKHEGGTTIGILPSDTKESANPYIDIPIPTGMGIARNVIVVRTSDVVIAIDGKYGTLSEIGYALNLGIPIVGLKTWNLDAPIKIAKTPKEAVELAFKLSSNQ